MTSYEADAGFINTFFSHEGPKTREVLVRTSTRGGPVDPNTPLGRVWSDFARQRHQFCQDYQIGPGDSYETATEKVRAKLARLAAALNSSSIAHLKEKLWQESFNPSLEAASRFIGDLESIHW